MHSIQCNYSLMIKYFPKWIKLIMLLGLHGYLVVIAKFSSVTCQNIRVLCTLHFKYYGNQQHAVKGHGKKIGKLKYPSRI